MRIDPNDAPRKVDKTLQDEYSVSLYFFTISLVDIFCFPDLRTLKLAESNYRSLPWREFWIKRITDLEKIKESTQITWKDFKRKSDPFLIPYKDTILKIENKIKNLPDHIDILIRQIKEDYLSISETKGASTNLLNTLFLVWSQFIKDKDKVHIQTLLSLLRWFSNRIKGHFYDEEVNIYFREEDIEDDNLNKLLYRFRQGELKSQESEVYRYLKRFLIPKQNNWMEYWYKKKSAGDLPLIIFSTGEKLMINDYFDNKLNIEPEPLANNSIEIPYICLDFKSLSYESDCHPWEVELAINIDRMEKELPSR
jgi:hypothetical protein